MWAFLIRDGFLIKGVSEAVDEYRKGVAQEVLTWFLILADLVSGKDSLHENL